MPKKVHHNPDYEKNKTADVIKHGSGRAVPNEQWECNINPDEPNKNNGIGAFEPKRSKERPSTHKKLTIRIIKMAKEKAKSKINMYPSMSKMKEEKKRVMVKPAKKIKTI